MKDPNKNEVITKYKQSRNFFITLSRKVSNFTLINLFKQNIKDLKIKTMRKGKNKMIALNKSNHTFPTAAADKNEIIAKPSDIANTFNNYFVNNAIDFHPPSDFP